MEDLKTMVFINKQEENWRFLLINRIETESKQEASMLINKRRKNGGLTEAKQIMLYLLCHNYYRNNLC